MRRALSLLALLVPGLAFAQTAGTIIVDSKHTEGTFLGIADCTGGTSETASTPGSLKITWNVAPTSGTFTGSGVFRIYASTKLDSKNLCFQQDDTSASAKAGKIGTDITASAQNGTITLSTVTILTAVGIAGTATNACTTDQTFYLCVHWIADINSGTVTGIARTQLQTQFEAPAVPINVSARPGESALDVSWAAGTSNTVTVDHYYVTATPVDATQDSVHHATTANAATLSTRVGGLKNNVPYAVTVQSVSQGGNGSEASAAVNGTPLPGEDFWKWYKDHGGAETGGCSTGAAGGLALLGVASLLAFCRRRSR